MAQPCCCRFECVCVCVCVRERERERERGCVCVYANSMQLTKQEVVLPLSYVHVVKIVPPTYIKVGVV